MPAKKNITPPSETATETPRKRPSESPTWEILLSTRSKNCSAGLTKNSADIAAETARSSQKKIAARTHSALKPYRQYPSKLMFMVKCLNTLNTGRPNMKTTNREKNKTLSLCIISASLMLLLFIPLSVHAQDPNSIDTLRQMGKAFAKISEKVSPAVVGIKANKTITQQYQTMPDWPFSDPFDDDLFERFFGRPSPRQRQRAPQPPQTRKFQQMAQGSGFIVSPERYIRTNNHLVGEAEKVMVKQGNNQEVEAKVIGRDPDSALAVINMGATVSPF